MPGDERPKKCAGEQTKTDQGATTEGWQLVCCGFMLCILSNTVHVTPRLGRNLPTISGTHIQDHVSRRFSQRKCLQFVSVKRLRRRVPNVQWTVLLAELASSFMNLDTSTETAGPCISGAAAGNRADLDSFIQRYMPVVRAYLGARWKSGPCVSQLEDATQEVFARIHQTRRHFWKVSRQLARGAFGPSFMGVVRCCGPTCQKLAEVGIDCRRRQRISILARLPITRRACHAFSTEPGHEAHAREAGATANRGGQNKTALRPRNVLSCCVYSFQEQLPIRTIR